jgi:3-deoxy-D-manno-octulosonic-acid transferase
VLSAIELWLYMAATRMAGRRLIQKLKLRSEQTGFSVDRFQERLGIASEPKKNGLLVWFHARNAASAMPLFHVIEQLNEQEIGLQFLVTTRRQESVDNLMDTLPENTIHQFFPIDLDEPIKAFLDHWSPDILVVSEGEFWPRISSRV